jgi:hypothetical protein
MSLPPGATLVSGQPPMPLPPGASLVSGGASQGSQPPQDSGWRKAYDYAGLGTLQKLTGQLSDWAKQKATEKQTEDQQNAAQGGDANTTFAKQAVSARAGYDLLGHTAGLVSSFLEPKNVAITAGVIAANTNPITGIPVDAALVAHGGYGVYKNAPAAIKGDPDAAERALLSGSEMAGGAAGVGGQVRAAPRAVQNVVNAQGLVRKTGSMAGVPLSTDVPAGPRVQPAAGATPDGDFISRTLGVTDPPPNQLLTKAIKPIASNTGWDSAIAKAAPDMKAAEADLGHPISGVDDALNAVSVAKKGIWKQYADKLKSAGTGMGDEETGATIDGNEIADAMTKSIDKRTALQDPGLVERITKVADTYRRPMGVEETEDFLQSANNDLHSYYAKNKVGRQVAEKDPATGHVVAEADQLRDSLYSKLDDLTGAGAADLKGRYGALSNVENELLRRKNVSARQQPESLAEQIGMARAIGKIAVGTARLSPTSILEGTQSLAAAKWLKTRGTTDAMITRAFQTLGSQGGAATPMPGPAPVTPTAAGAGAGFAAPDETPDTNKVPIASLLNYDPVQARQAFKDPIVQHALNTLNPGAANSVIRKYGVADTRKYFKERNA